MPSKGQLKLNSRFRASSLRQVQPALKVLGASDTKKAVSRMAHRRSLQSKQGEIVCIWRRDAYGSIEMPLANALPLTF
jgi:hypothetical protein